MHCDSCDQSTHQLDRDSIVPCYLTWHKKHWQKKNNRFVPSGSECAKCFDTRRAYFAKEETQEALGVKRSNNESLNDTFLEMRKDRVQTGGEKFQHLEKTTAEAHIARIEAAFKEKYNEGTFLSVMAFARQRHLPTEGRSYEEIKQEIVDKFNKDIVVDDDGVEGIASMDLDFGSDVVAYRFKAGKKMEVVKSGSEKYDSKQMVCGRFDYLATAPSSKKLGGGQARKRF